MSESPSLLVLSGVSGSGKSHFTDLLSRERGYSVVPSLTTRAPREEEVTGDRRFCSLDDFERLRDDGRLLCTRFFFGNWYALDKCDIERALSTGRAVAQLTYKSLSYLKSSYPGAVCIYVQPHPVEQSTAAVRSRGLGEAEMAERINEIAEEMKFVAANKNVPEAGYTAWYDNHFFSGSDKAFLALVDRLRE